MMLSLDVCHLYVKSRPLPLRLPPRVSPCPPNHPMTGFENMIHAQQESFSSDERECTDVCVRQLCLQARRSGQERSALGHNVVNEHDPMTLLCPTYHAKRLVVLANRRPCSARRRRRFPHGEPPLQAQPHATRKSDVPERYSQLGRSPPGTLRRRASRYGNKHGFAREQCCESRVARALPAHTACVSREPNRIAALYPCTQPARGLAKQICRPRGIDIAGGKRHAAARKHAVSGPFARRASLTVKVRGRQMPVAPNRALYVRLRRARPCEAAHETGRSFSRSPGSADGARPPVPDGVSPRRP